ncbi:medium-chain acyl-CoA ligase ACSF2, mitochondrial-like, partial [Panonychus citri]|uniref:medium-chain acyl-CoA ligase ACSF2, mitochondrial-like n=1 Tax=Panonychus citri TaxID=50023 RepID=UPI00230804CD
FILHPYSYAYGVSPANLEFYSIGDALQLSSDQRNSQPAIISGHQKIVKSFGDLNKEVNQLVDSFDSVLGLTKGDVVSLWSSNCYEWILIQLACARYGLVLCTLNPVYKLPELEYALAKSGAKVLFVPGQSSQQTVVNDFANIASKLNRKTNSTLEKLVQIDGDNLTSLEFDKFSLKQLLSSSDGSTTTSSRVNSDDPAIIMFTSGTTGKPKGALLSHCNLINNAQLTARRLGLDEPGTVAAIPVPLFHIFGLVYGITMMARMGITITLSGYRYNVKSLVETINENNCSHAMIVPAMTIDLINYLEKNNITMPSLKTVITGSAPTTVETVHIRFLKVNPHTENYLIRYESTETGTDSKSNCSSSFCSKENRFRICIRIH